MGGGRGSLHDWVNVAVAVCALCVSIVSLWTTTQISGLQDYLQSEIRRRNNELNGIADRSRRLERSADSRLDENVALQTTAERVVSETIAAQQRLGTTQSELTRTQSAALAARIDLLSAKGEASRLGQLIDKKANEFDLFSRRQARNSIGLMLIFDLMRDDSDPTGEKALQSLRSLNAASDEPELAPYIRRVASHANASCPFLRDWHSSLPPKPTPPPRPTITYMSNASKSEIARLTREAQEKWSNDQRSYSDANFTRLEKVNAESEKLQKAAVKCACFALADEKFSAEQICPSDFKKSDE